MIIGVTMLIVSFLYLLLTGIMYYSKQRINNEENNIYNYLIIAAFFGIVLELTCILTVPYQDNIPILNEIVNRLFLIYIFTWTFLFTKYIILISFNNKKPISLYIIEHHVNSSIKNRKCHLEIVIKDNGKGMDKYVVNHLFENFTRASDYKDSATAGLGLGLAITKRLVDILNGEISCTTSAKGTTFEIKLTQKVGKK